MFLLPLLLATAPIFAQDLLGEPVYAQDLLSEPATLVPAEPLPPTVADRIDDAIQLRLSGDNAAATALLAALDVPPEHRTWWLYERGICAELAQDTATAERFYHEAIEGGGPFALDARFRLALVLEAEGRVEEAYAEMRTLGRVQGLDEADVWTVQLQKGIAEVGAGKLRRGVRDLEEALTNTEGSINHRYLRAKARYTLATVLLASAAEETFSGPERRVVQRLTTRVGYIQAAEEQIMATIQMEEVEWILAGLVALGDAYRDLGDALAAMEVPRGYSAEEAQIFNREISIRIGNVRRKAWEAYDGGIRLAARLNWESPRVAVLAAHRDALRFEEAAYEKGADAMYIEKTPG